MKCAVHADTEASGYCRNCGKAMCAACSHRVRDVLYCEDCLAQHVGLPPVAPPSAAPDPPANPGPYVPTATPQLRQGNSPVLAFLLGFIPGLGAVYNGEYNKAIIHIVVFGAIILGIASDLGESLQGLLIFALVISPFYMAIDALFLLNNFGFFEFFRVRQIFVPLLLIGIGFFMLKNRVSGKN